MPQGKTKLVPGAAGGLGRTETKIQFLTFWQTQKIFCQGLLCFAYLAISAGVGLRTYFVGLGLDWAGLDNLTKLACLIQQSS